MQMSRHFQARAAGLVRMLVVASATLSILLVCFAIYHYSQLDPGSAPRRPGPRLPSVSSGPLGDIPQDDPAEAQGVLIGGGVIGPARDIKLTIYPREGTRASLEIEVRDWRPKPNTANEFLLYDPIIRTRTKDGHAVRISARQGTLEARRRRGGSLDPQRGRLVGDVVVEYDRLSDEQREAMGGGSPDSIDPADLIRLETDEIEFDYEFAKLIVPGDLHLRARELDLDGIGLEIILNETQGGIDSLRIRRGGRIELRGTGEGLGLSLPGFEGRGEQRVTLVDWIRSAVVARLAASATSAPKQEEAAQTPAHLQPTQSTVMMTDEGVPVFRAGAKGSGPARPPVRYHARFEGNVHARRWSGQIVQAGIRADSLEIIRDFGSRDREQMDSSPRPWALSDRVESANESDDRLVLEWSGPLVVKALHPEEGSSQELPGPQIIVGGAPARIFYKGGEATCARAIFHPDSSEAQLFGTRQEPFVVRSVEQGVVTGQALYWEGNDDKLYVRVTGPGTLVQSPSTPSPGTEALTGAVQSATASRRLRESRGDEYPPTVEFAGGLEVYGRRVTQTTLGLDGWLTTRGFWIIERTSFAGPVRVQDEDTHLVGDALRLTFGIRRSWNTVVSVIKRLQVDGHVELVRGRDRIRCRELDVEMARDNTGRAWARTATAIGDVVAVQGRRRITAGDKLVVNFARVASGALSGVEPQALVSALAVSSEQQVPPAGQGPTLETTGQGEEKMYGRQVRVTHLYAVGGVTVTDPAEALDLAAKEFSCNLLDDGQIDTVVATGSENEPASVRLGDLTVAGGEIRLDTPAECVDVSGKGRLTLMSFKDLNGRKLLDPIPITVTWDDRMKYRGREDRAVFSGNVHASSQSNRATFDCDQLMIEFDEVSPQARDQEQGRGWELAKNALDWFLAKTANARGMQAVGFQPKPASKWNRDRRAKRRASKEPAYLLATGNAVAVTSETDPLTGKLTRRARLSGPKLSVSLRPGVSKMLIEGAGNLQLEDFRSAGSRPQDDATPSQADLFDIDSGAGPSKTLIEWNDAMWYDFSIDQTRFEGRVRLKHFSGARLARLFGETSGSTDAAARLAPGRSTFMTCNTLTVDFGETKEQRLRSEGRRLGRISTGTLRRFQAEGSVVLQDQSEGLTVWSDRIVYERPREILVIFGSPMRKARIVTQKPGRPPNQMTVDRLIYNLATGEAELLGPLATGR